MRRVTNTASVSLAGNRYTVEQALVGRRVELRFDPEDLTKLDVYWAGVMYREVGRDRPTDAEYARHTALARVVLLRGSGRGYDRLA